MKSTSQCVLPLLLLANSLGFGLPRLTPAAERPRDRRPNIIVIMADDMGYSDLHCYGSEINTPNLDTLARNGIRFTQFYNTARCCPTRAALLTGLYSHQAGVGHMVADKGFPAYQGFLNERCVTLAEVLRPAGYHTLMSGKWHVGENRPHWPVDRGFEHSFALISGGSSYFKLDEGRKMAIDEQPYTPPTNGYYLTDAISEHAVRFIREYAPKPEPFFLYVAYTSPHWPLHALPEDIARYQGKYLGGWDKLREQRHQRMIELGIVNATWPLTPRDPAVPAWDDAKNKELWDLKMAVYAAQIDRMDQGIGRIAAQLREAGELENTLILFLADNGGCAEKIDRGTPGALPGTPESFVSYDPPWANASNTPFRLYKHWEHEGGIAAPLIAHWPKGIPAPRRNRLEHQPAHLIDLMATAVDLAGAQYPSEFKGNKIQSMEGTSLRPAFAGKSLRRPTPLFWEHEGNRAIRDGKWKLVSKHPGAWELYDLESDRTELKNLASQFPEKARELARKWERWAQRVGVQPWPIRSPAPSPSQKGR